MHLLIFLILLQLFLQRFSLNKIPHIFNFSILFKEFNKSIRFPISKRSFQIFLPSFIILRNKSIKFIYN